MQLPQQVSAIRHNLGRQAQSNPSGDAWIVHCRSNAFQVSVLSQWWTKTIIRFHFCYLCIDIFICHDEVAQTDTTFGRILYTQPGTLQDPRVIWWLQLSLQQAKRRTIRRNDKCIDGSCREDIRPGQRFNTTTNPKQATAKAATKILLTWSTVPAPRVSVRQISTLCASGTAQHRTRRFRFLASYAIWLLNFDSA